MNEAEKLGNTITEAIRIVADTALKNDKMVLELVKDVISRLLEVENKVKEIEAKLQS